MYLQSLAVREERPLVEKIRTRQVQSQKRQSKDLNCVRCRQEVQEVGRKAPDHSLDVEMRGSPLVVKRHIPGKC